MLTPFAKAASDNEIEPEAVTAPAGVPPVWVKAKTTSADAGPQVWRRNARTTALRSIGYSPFAWDRPLPPGGLSPA